MVCDRESSKKGARPPISESSTCYVSVIDFPFWFRIRGSGLKDVGHKVFGERAWFARVQVEGLKVRALEVVHGKHHGNEFGGGFGCRIKNLCEDDLETTLLPFVDC